MAKAKGTNALDFKNNLGQYESGTGDTAALLGGFGTATVPMDMGSVANKNMVGI